MRMMAFALMSAAAAGPASADLRLLMFEQPGCAYCAEWDRVIAPIYPLTKEGQAAPLDRVQIRGAYPVDVHLASRPNFTPTFVLVSDGAEAGRIEGYPGEDFFWGLLEQMLRKTGKYREEGSE